MTTTKCSKSHIRTWNIKTLIHFKEQGTMEALRASSFSSFQFTTIPPRLPRLQFEKPMLNFPINHRPNSSFSSAHHNKLESRLFSATSPTVSAEFADPPEQELEFDSPGEKFDWFAQWYPVMPVCDLDKRVPHAKKVLGLDVVVWWDRNENAWKVFDDRCPHRLAPLSEGRIDQWGRLQCVYHGWCFSGSGDCKFIPQAPPEGPPVHTFKNACVAVYPTTVQNDIVWFWPNSDPQYKDIITKQKPPYMPELDDPSYTKSMGNREIPYGYAQIKSTIFSILLIFNQKICTAGYSILLLLIELLADREGGRPLDMSIKKSDVNGFIARQEAAYSRFIAPCIFSAFTSLAADQSNGSESSAGTKEEPSSPVAQRRFALIFICVPERKIMDIGLSNWQKACFVPTKSDALVVGFRRWLNKYAGGQVDWGTKFSGALPPSPPREQLLDRYWSHVVNCSSCRVAYKGLNAVEVVLQVIAFATIGIVAAVKQEILSSAARNTLVVIAVLCFVGSRWLSHFVYKNFHYHDYNHALR
ncbi:hypothetical protein RHMOL_Rhmol01G0247900 [Rhododendron molle]|uniref:Uncharacterized protein n=1 Tax=Rhododendron molle TaxID=49168 RepID=A0ACC0Q8H6_RHOML|nr:hypothetical protein RHMOL_Rhmol01G0247900 [Rhododendron molle]